MSEILPANPTTQHPGPLRRWRWLVVGLALLGLLGWGYSRSTQTVVLVINGQSTSIETHHRQVEDIVQQLGLRLEPADRLQPAPQATLDPGDTLTIELARPVILNADGQTRRLFTHAQTVATLLAELGLTIQPRDELFLNNLPVAPDAPLPAPVSNPEGSAATARSEPVRLSLHRAAPVTLHNGPATSTFYSARLTVGEALLEQGITLYLGDKITPDPGMPLSPGMHVYLQPATPVSIKADGRIIKTRSQGQTVGQVLAQEGIALMGQDYSRPSTAQPIAANDTIELVRVREAMEISEEFIPFETEWVADDSMELDQREIRQAGATGVIKTRTRLRFENGQEISRQVEDEWLAQEPANQVIAYGTNIVVRTLDTPNGPIEYWRRINMRSTAYNAAASGKDADHPRYGITRSGLPAGFGVVAVDPRVIPLLTELYVEDYGRAVAGDTGGRILGRHIDLGFDDDEPLPVIFNWRDVYVLTPVPPAGQIRYVLPNWPQ